jgi:hypothetical protein
VNEIDASTRWGYLYNPHGIWDWYVIGGRWSGELKTKDGSMVNYAKIKDVDFSPNLEVYNIEKRFWELIVEGASLNEGEDKPWSMWKPEYYIEKYGDAETYANHMANFSTFSLIDVEGNYFEQGSMGWFGVSDSDVESLATYKNDFERVFAQANPEHYLVLVDCHI